MLEDDVITKDQDKFLRNVFRNKPTGADGIRRDKAKLSSFLIGGEMLQNEFHKDDSRFRHFSLIYNEKDGQINDLAFAVFEEKEDGFIEIVPGTFINLKKAPFKGRISLV